MLPQQNEEFKCYFVNLKWSFWVWFVFMWSTNTSTPSEAVLVIRLYPTRSSLPSVKRFHSRGCIQWDAFLTGSHQDYAFISAAFIVEMNAWGWNRFFLWCHFVHSRTGRLVRCWLKRRITHGGISVLISPPREAISLWGQWRGLPIIQGQGGGNEEG